MVMSSNKCIKKIRLQKKLKTNFPLLQRCNKTNTLNHITIIYQ
jgi:hypothetical protein